MINLTKRLFILGIGWAFILLGILGLFLPVLQGILFMLIGLLILSKESKTAHNLLQKMKARYPQPFQTATRLRRRFVVRISRLVGR